MEESRNAASAGNADQNTVITARLSPQEPTGNTAQAPTSNGTITGTEQAQEQSESSQPIDKSSSPLLRVSRLDEAWHALIQMI